MESVKITKAIVPESLCKKIIKKYSDFLKEHPEEMATLVDPIKEFIVSNRDKEWIEIENEIRPSIDRAVVDYLDQFGGFPGLVGMHNYRFGSSMIVHQPEKYNIVYHYDSELEMHLGVPEIRSFGVLLYLNKDYTEGDLVFPLQDIIVSPEAGMLCIFPTSFMYPHLTTPPIGSQRYVMRFNYFFKQEPIINSPRQFI